MKKILLIIFYGCSSFLAQENQSQSIELPDFVITGNENITVPKIQKSQQNLIPLISKDFLTPLNVSDDDIDVELPEIENSLVSIPKFLQSTNALLKLRAGIHTWPSGEFYYNSWQDNFSYSAHIFGLNELEYVKKAGLSFAGMGLGSKYFVPQESSFLPGLEIDLNGNYLYEQFNFYGSQNFNLVRKTNNGFAELSFNYLANTNSKFGITFSDNYYEQKDDAISENVFGTKAFLNLKLLKFDFRLEGSVKNQSTNSVQFANDNNSYFSSKVSLGIMLFNSINIKGGMYLSESQGNTFFAPHAYGSIKFNKSLSFFGEFSPYTDFLTLRDFKNNNRYYQLNNFAHLYVENKFNLKVAAKFEYEKYFEINGGVGYLNSDNNFYYEDNFGNGLFTIHKQDTEKSYAFMNFLFRKGPLGEFYSEIKLQDVSSSNSKTLPYSSSTFFSLNYAYDWTYFTLGINVNYYSESFVDYENINKIPSKTNVEINMGYELLENFNITLSLQNILNDKYYYFRNYKAKPLDLLAGFELRW